ncbi:cyclopropane fatty-acyl-phospholipid synthase-like methyltransferase [Cytobacillus eiseniae]|uniref:Cyclopropane fatty-acyl-phospholipid synthase-like methyltransferase n=1 Tax=Cytobacillus eiseniae TaxID=762947 RepID=A0ABS4RJ70_9BACI|nr:class I SAM-dependent methyltransferase [Cytobacillus eiseniae]MBP2242828.1 cyclopropane fatty-acyl-phospholipid synthase-like methyltransferase [Cytobacillus eiseniae]
MSNHWNDRFQAKNYVYGTEPNVFISDMQLKLQLSGEALAIAEGEGRNAVFLAEKGMKVTAWDFAESGLLKTRKLAESKGVTVQTELVDLNEAVWETGLWDSIVCVFGHFPKETRKRTFEGVKKAVKPGGYYVSEVYSIHQLSYKSGGPKDINFLYSPEEFLQAFLDWKIVHFFMGEAIRHEGELHTGLAHIIQFVAQKPE